MVQLSCRSFQRLTSPILFLSILWLLVHRYALNSTILREESERLGPFSSVRCTSTDNPRHRRCHFRNVCINRTSGRVFYYRPQHHMRVPLVDVSFSTGLPQPLVFIRAGIPANFSIAVDVVYSRLPERDYDELNEDVAIIYEPFWPANFGHAIGDDFFPFWRLLRRFRLLGRNNGYRMFLTGVHWFCNGTRDERCGSYLT